MPLKDAVEQISQRQAVGTRLSSAEWDVVPAEIRLRTMWAARLESERMAASMQEKIAQFIALERTKLEDGGEGVFMDRGLFMEKMRAEFKKAGYRPDPKKKGTLQDFTSAGRLGLIWDMNQAQAQGYAQWKTGQSAVALRMWPAMEFVRLENRVERRAWSARWKALGGKFYPGPSEYPEGRMIALKNDPIWKALNRFGVPWKPFDWGSGMGTRNIGRREALALGVVKEGDAPQAAEALPFNAGAEASLKGISPSRRRAIEDAFMGDVEIEGDMIRLLPAQELAKDFKIPAVPASLSAEEKQAGDLVAGLSADNLAKMVGELEKTVAWTRLKSASGDSWDETAALERAATQWLASQGGKQSEIGSMRLGGVRDAFWGTMDFLGASLLIADLLGGDV